MSIIRKIKILKKELSNKEKILFTTPSHLQSNFIPHKLRGIIGKEFYESDISEIDGFDNLRHPKGIIKKLQTKLSKIYDSKSTFLLTNGSSSGIIAALKSIVDNNDKVLIARNCHISVYNGLVLTGAIPTWFYPEFDKEWGIYRQVQPEKIKQLFTQNQFKALVITSPTYEGIYSNISEIAQICKKHNTKLIVDEAHGALLNFGDYKTPPAIKCGADISIQSLHKNAGAPNPCALLHLGKTSQIAPEAIQESLNVITTTSPSYPLMMAIEATVDFLSSNKGQGTIKKLQNNIEKLKQNLNNDIVFFDNDDNTKLVLKLRNIGCLEAINILNNKFKIEEEFSDKNHIVFLTGVGTNYTNLKQLEKALSKIVKIKTLTPRKKSKHIEKRLPIKTALTPSQAFNRKKISIKKDDAIGEVCGEIIMKYPPGIPILLPGEIIQPEHISDIEKDFIKICN